MSEPLTRQEVAKVAELAMLELSEDELITFTGQLAAVLEHAQDIDDLDVGDVPPTNHPYPLTNVFRDDVIEELDDIRTEVLAAAPESEDGQFRFHRGVDWRELNAVIDDALDGEKTRGASTLPMQVAKNLFLWPHRSFVRKIFEIPYALFADLVWSKRRMMEIYLNMAEWDEGVFGIEAASRHYFNRSASRLTRSQAALLTVTLPNPAERNPAKPSRALSKLAKVIERRASQSGAYVKCLKN